MLLLDAKIRIKTKYTLLLIALIAIIAYITFIMLSDNVDSFFLFGLFAVIQATLLTVSGNGRDPLFYVQVKERYIISEDVREVLRILSYSVGSFALTLSLSVFGVGIIDLFIPSTEVDVFSPIYQSMCLLISGVTFVFIRVFFTKLISSEEKILIRGGINE
jgi:hypothetical protein